MFHFELFIFHFLKYFPWQFAQLATKPEEGLSAEEFSKSIICYLKPELIRKYANHIEGLNLKGTISLQEYINFQDGIVNQYEDIKDRLSEKGVLTYKRFLSFFDSYARVTQTEIPTQAISILFKVLDFDSKHLIATPFSNCQTESGKLEQDEFENVLKCLSWYGGEQPETKRLIVPMKEFKSGVKKWANKIERIWKILQE